MCTFQDAPRSERAVAIDRRLGEIALAVTALTQRANELRKEIADKKKKQTADDKAAKEKFKTETKYLQALLASNPVSCNGPVILLASTVLPYNPVKGWLLGQPLTFAAGLLGLIIR